LVFKLNYNAGWGRIDMETLIESGLEILKFDKNHEQIEVLISDNNGANWTKIWTTDELSYTNAELEDFLLSLAVPWISVDKDLTAYAGKSVQFAFRYVNDGSGESAYLDDVQVAVYVPQPAAFYTKPAGSLYWGLSENFESFLPNVIFNPAYVPVQWISHKNAETQSVDWDFYSIEDDDFTNNIEESDPEVTYPWSLSLSPYLNAYHGEVNSTFRWGVSENSEGFLISGGKAEYTFSQDGLVSFSAGNYDLEKAMTHTGYNADTVIFSKDFWDTHSDMTFKGVANYFEKPLSKFMFETFYVHLYYQAIDPNTELRLDLIRVDEAGYLQDTIASSTIFGSDIPVPEDLVKFPLTTASFNFVAIDPDGRETDTYVEIDDAFIAVLTGFTNHVNFLMQDEDHTLEEHYAYVLFEESLLPVSVLFPRYTSFYFGMDVTFPFLYTENNRYEAPTSGGAVNFEIITYWLPGGWWLEEELPEWITLGTPSLNQANGIVTLPVTVVPLPAGSPGRNANIRIASYACDLTLQVKQGDADWPTTGISTVQSVASVKAVRQGDNFQLSYPASATSVSVYNIAGQRIAEHKLNVTGTYTLPAGNLAKGVYVLKFNGTNSAIKILK
jgi:hypothetical protein